MVARRRAAVAAGCVGGRVSVASPSAAESIPKCHNSAACSQFRPKQRAKRPQSPVYPPIRAASTPARTPPGRRQRPTARPTNQPANQPTDQRQPTSASRPADQPTTDQPTSRPTSRPADQPTSRPPTAGDRGSQCDFDAAADCHIVTP